MRRGTVYFVALLIGVFGIVHVHGLDACLKSACTKNTDCAFGSCCNAAGQTNVAGNCALDPTKTLALGDPCDPLNPCSQCDKGLLCDSTTLKCSCPKTIGESCTTPDDCFPNTCTNNVCTRQGTYGFNADSCQVDSNCFSGKCAAGKCAGKQLNDPCTGGDCDGGLGCDPSTNTCKQVFQRDPCVNDGDCGVIGTCDKTQKKCVSDFSTGTGSPCVNDFNCLFGKACIGGLCTLPGKCNNTLPCASAVAGSQCECSGTQSRCSATINDRFFTRGEVQSCLQLNKCQWHLGLPFQTVTPDLCGVKECEAVMVKFMCASGCDDSLPPVFAGFSYDCTKRRLTFPKTACETLTALCGPFDGDVRIFPSFFLVVVGVFALIANRL